MPVLEYILRARSGGDLDFKAHTTIGTRYYDDKFVSPRDAGNFLAGMYAASKKFLTPIILFGYGAYNFCGNNLLETAKFCVKCVVPFVNLDLIKKGLKGEDELSGMVQNMGLEYQKSKE